MDAARSLGEFTEQEDAAILRFARQSPDTREGRVSWKGFSLAGRSLDSIQSRWRLLRRCGAEPGMPTPASARRPRRLMHRRFTREEDDALQAAVQAGLPWHEMRIPGRSPNQLRLRWRRCLTTRGEAAAPWQPFPSAPWRPRQWLPEEDRAVLAAAEEGVRWRDIPARVPGRTARGIAHRWALLQHRAAGKNLAARSVRSRTARAMQAERATEEHCESDFADDELEREREPDLNLHFQSTSNEGVDFDFGDLDELQRALMHLPM